MRKLLSKSKDNPTKRARATGLTPEYLAKFTHDNTPAGMVTPEGRVRVAEAHAALEAAATEDERYVALNELMGALGGIANPCESKAGEYLLAHDPADLDPENEQ